MKNFIRTVLFHFLCIIIFSIVYINLENNFKKDNTHDKEQTFIDFVLLSTTIQAGVGISDLYPVSIYGKVAVLLQQLIMLCTHVFTIYVFNI